MRREKWKDKIDSWMKTVEKFTQVPSREEMKSLRLLVVSNKLFDSEQYRETLLRVKDEKIPGAKYIKACNVANKLEALARIKGNPPLEAYYWDRIFVDEVHEFCVQERIYFSMFFL